MEEPKYKDLKFETEEEFQKWLKEKAKFKVGFEDEGQDFLFWWIDERGEVLHSELQSAIWTGKMVKKHSLVVGGYVIFSNGDTIKYKIESVEKL